MVYTPYCYLIGWSKQNKYYYGARWAKESKCLYESGCHPDDFWVTYHTTSNFVTEMVEKYGDPDVIKIRKTFTTAAEAIKYEKKVLKRLKAVEKPLWLNQNGSTGRGVIIHSELTRARMSEARKGRPCTWGDKISKAKKGCKYEGRGAPFKLIATTPDGITEEYIFRDKPFMTCYNQLGVSQSRIKMMKRGKPWVIKKVDPNTRHKWSKGTKVSVTLL